ncbi:hypothetical protein QF047_002874 [Arthrobacter sp. W4I7]|nr:hypothetical protein [Arthrobacter sp. W4I7]
MTLRSRNDLHATMGRDALLREGPPHRSCRAFRLGNFERNQLPTVMIGRLPPPCNSRHLHSGALHEYPLPNVPHGLPQAPRREATFLAGGGPSECSASRRIGHRRSLSDRRCPYASKRRPEGPDASLRASGRDLRAKRRRRAGCGTQAATQAALKEGYSPRTSEASSHSSSRVSFSSARSLSCLFCPASASKSDFSVLLTMSSWSFFSC